MAVAQKKGGRETSVGGPTIFDVDASTQASGRKVNVPEVAIGLLLVVSCALGALWWQTKSYPNTSVIIASQPLQRGELVAEDALGVVEMESNDPVTAIAADQKALVVGQLAVIDVEPGTILSPSMVSETADIGPDEAVVGLFLRAGQVPSLHLDVGSLVEIISAGEASQAGAGSVLVEAAEVVDVAAGGGFGEMLVSIRVPRSQALPVAAAGNRGEIVLVEVSDR